MKILILSCGDRIGILKSLARTTVLNNGPNTILHKKINQRKRKFSLKLSLVLRLSHLRYARSTSIKNDHFFLFL